MNTLFFTKEKPVTSSFLCKRYGKGGKKIDKKILSTTVWKEKELCDRRLFILRALEEKLMREKKSSFSLICKETMALYNKFYFCGLLGRTSQSSALRPKGGVTQSSALRPKGGVIQSSALRPKGGASQGVKVIINTKKKVMFQKSHYSFSCNGNTKKIYLNKKDVIEIGSKFSQKFATKEYEKYSLFLVNFVFCFEHYLSYYLFDQYFCLGKTKTEKMKMKKNKKDNVVRRNIFGTFR